MFYQQVLQICNVTECTLILILVADANYPPSIHPYQDIELLPKHETIKNSTVPKLILYNYMLSPLWSVNLAKENLNQVLLKMSEHKIIQFSPTTSNYTLWSKEGNIEYVGATLYSPMSQESFTTNNALVSYHMTRPFHSCIINVSFGKNIVCNPLITEPIELNQEFFHEYAKILLHLQPSTTLGYDLCKVFYSTIQPQHFEHIKKTNPNLLCTMFIREGSSVYMTGDVIVLPDLTTFTQYMIIVQRDASTTDVLLEVNETYITANNSDIFQKVLIGLMEVFPEIEMPERYSNKVKYEMKMPSKIKPSITDFRFSEKFFAETKGGMNTLNIINTLDDLHIPILISKFVVRFELAQPNDELAKFIADFLYAMNQTINAVDNSYSFGFVGGIYWSRICQNSGDKIRKPTRITTDIQKYVPEGVFHKTDTYEAVLINQDVYMCSKEVNGKLWHLGFAQKIYETSNVCKPCCFQYEQYERDTFKLCVGGGKSEAVPKREDIQPFVIDENKSINLNRLAFLPKPLEEYLISKKKTGPCKLSKKRIETSKGSCFLYGGTKAIEVKSLESYMKSEDAKGLVVFSNNKFYFPLEECKYLYVHIKNFVYQVVRVYKEFNQPIRIEPMEFTTADIGIESEIVTHHSSGRNTIQGYIRLGCSDAASNIGEIAFVDSLAISTNINMVKEYNTRKACSCV